MQPPLISLIVLGYRHFDKTTKPCLESLQPWFNDPEIEFIVVDNASPDDSAQKTQEWCGAFANIKCLLNEENLGYAGGMNFGASHATGKWLFLVNNDTVFPANALDALKTVVSDAPSQVAMIGPITNAAGNGQRICKPGASFEDWLVTGAWLNTHPTRHLMPTYRCDFFCIAIRHDVWRSLGGLDTSFGLGYYEDFDFSLRLRAAGWEQKITEDVFVMHLGSATFQGDKAARNLMRTNKKRLQQKHPNARFEHARLGNVAVLNRYVDLKNTELWSAALEFRAADRLAALKNDQPKSFLKRLLWSLKTKRMIKSFG